MRSTDYRALFISLRPVAFGAFQSSHCFIVLASSCSVCSPLLYCFLLLCFSIVGIHASGIPIPLHLLMLLGYVASFLDLTCVPVRISINKLDLVPNWLVASLVGTFRNGRGFVTGESYIPVMLLHRSPCFSNVDFAVLAGNPVDCCLAGLTVSFGQTTSVTEL